MGFAIASPHLPDSSPDELLRWADQALYQAKYAGRNQFRVAALSRAVCESCEEVGNEIDQDTGQATDPDRCKEVCPGVCELKISAS
jgi:predicted signal transduction protein with EAL and GGDEF domain